MIAPMNDGTRTAAPFLAALHEARGLLEGHRAEADRAVRLTEPVHALFRDAGLYKLLVPREFGGAELALPAALEVFAAACRIDAVAGWCLTIGAGGGPFAAWLPGETAAAMYTPADALVAGSGAPTGRLEAVDGGYRVSGRWGYASGIAHATWVTANAQLEDGSGIRAVAVPAAAVTVEADWDTAALRGTGSHTVVLDDVFVPADHSFSLTEAPRLDRPLYRFPFLAFAEASFAAAILGTARGALDAFYAGPAQRTVAGRPAAEHDGVRCRVARAEAELGAAEAFLSAAVSAAWASAEHHEPIAEEAARRIALAAVHGARAAQSAAAGLREASGMQTLARDDRLARALRDTAAMGQHVMLSPFREAELGAALLH